MKLHEVVVVMDQPANKELRINKVGPHVITNINVKDLSEFEKSIFMNFNNSIKIDLLNKKIELELAEVKSTNEFDFYNFLNKLFKIEDFSFDILRSDINMCQPITPLFHFSLGKIISHEYILNKVNNLYGENIPIHKLRFIFALSKVVNLS